MVQQPARAFSFCTQEDPPQPGSQGNGHGGTTDVPPKSYMEFDAEILCLYHSTTLSVGSCMVLHAASIRQTVRIVGIAKLDGKPTINPGPADAGKPVVRTGDRAKLRLQFIRYRSMFKPGDEAYYS